MSTLSFEFAAQLLIKAGVIERDSDLTRMITNREIQPPILDSQGAEIPGGRNLQSQGAAMGRTREVTQRSPIMTIRARMQAIKAKPPKGRAPVQCKSAAEAEAVKRQWALENAVRTLDARIAYLAGVLDKIAARQRPARR